VIQAAPMKTQIHSTGARDCMLPVSNPDENSSWRILRSQETCETHYEGGDAVYT